jgi:prolyl oligopeptidase
MKFLVIILLTIFSGNLVKSQQTSNNDSVIDTIWGQQVHDPYRWLERIHSIETSDWIEKQNLLTNSHQGKYYQNFVNHINLYSSIDYKPLTKEGKYFFTYKVDDSQKAPVLYFQTRPEQSEKKLFDPSSIESDKNYSIDGFKISPDNKILALILSEGRSDWKTIKFLEIASGKLLKETLNFIKYSSVYWSENGLFYVSYDIKDKGQSFKGLIDGRKLFYHKLGTSQADDIIVYAAKYSNEFFSFQVTPYGKYLVLYHNETIDGVSRNVVSIKNLPLDPSSDFKRLIVSNKRGDYFKVIGENGERVLVETNSNAANGAIFSYNPNLTNSREIFINPYSERLEYVKMLYKSILRIYNNGKQSFAIVCNMRGEQLAAWTIPEGYTFSPFSGSVNEKIAIYHFGSFFSPGYFYQLDLETFERKPLGKTTTFFDIKDLTTQKVWYRSKDSTLIPMYLTHLKSLKQNGKNPAILYGYGGFGISMEPFFNVANLIFLKNGGVLATPALRGGGDFPGWHEQGMRHSKQNTFDDFIAAAEYIIAEKYANPNRIAAMGGSNGGLVVGTAMVQRPDLFKVVVSNAGLFDMLRYHLYNIGYVYSDEFGNANDSTDFVNLYKYSPYHNVKEGIEYPATLLVASSNDDRVNPFHSFKFLSQLQEKGLGNNPYVLYYEKNAGHSGSAAFDSRVNRDAYIYSFIFSHLDMDRRVFFNFYED